MERGTASQTSPNPWEDKEWLARCTQGWAKGGWGRAIPNFAFSDTVWQMETGQAEVLCTTTKIGTRLLSLLWRAKY